MQPFSSQNASPPISPPLQTSPSSPPSSPEASSPCCSPPLCRGTRSTESSHISNNKEDCDQQQARSNCFCSIPCAGDNAQHREITLADGREEEDEEEEETLAEQLDNEGSSEKTAPSSSSSWSSLFASTIAALESKADYLGRSLVSSRKGKGERRWNAAVRRAFVSSPMRRLQERFLGSRLSPSSAAAASSSSIWLLGVCYHIGEENTGDDNLSASQIYTEFLEDLSSRIWFTYRKGFEAVGSAKLTTDVGWGCMLRSGQMLLAQALVCHILGRQWRREMVKSKEYLEILQRFGESSSKDCPFSIHNILNAGSPFGLVAGSWLGPYALCRALEALACAYKDHIIGEKETPLPMAIYVVSGDADGEQGGAPCICIDDVDQLCSSWQSGKDGWAPLLLLIPLVLGLDKINSRYLPSLSTTFSFPQSLGIVGGKPGASTYLVGVQDDHAIYLDPHEVQQAIAISPSNPEIDTSSYHCSVVRQMLLSSIDSSLALGFYCRTRDEFDDLCNRASELAKESNGAPMFTVVQTGNRIDRGSLSNVRGKLMEAQDSNKEIDDMISSEEDWQIL